MFCLLSKLAMRGESVAKVGEDFAAVVLLLLGYAILGEQEVE